MMKTKLLAILAASAFTFSACSDDDNPGTETGDVVLTELNGNITGKATVTAASIKLTGATIVRSGATLTIPAGTKIVANAGGTGVYLLVERGGKIIADGTADKPIVFTSGAAQPKAGDWGGLLINGYSRLSGVNGSVAEGNTEINSDIKYGGDKTDDDSGILDYIVLEYTGAKIDEGSEHNGLTLNGVGNGTKISNIFITEGADDGIEFFGGSVDVTNLLVVNSQDDMFDFTQGYTGTLKNSYGIWEEGYTSSSSDPRGIEADGNLDGDFPTHVNQSNFTVADMTIVNKSASAMNAVIKVRRGAQATITNLAIKADAASTLASIINLEDGSGDASQETSISYFLDPTSLFDISKIKNRPLATVTKSETALTGANTSVFAWTGYTF